MRTALAALALAILASRSAEACPCVEGDLTYSDEDARQCAYFIQTHRSVRPCIEQIRAAEARLKHQTEVAEAAQRAADKTNGAVAPDPTPPTGADDRALLPLAPAPPPPRKISAAEKEASAARRKAREERAAATKAEKAEKDRQLQEVAERADARFCGEEPKKRAWSGIYAGLEDAVKGAAHDPDSVEFVACTDIEKKRMMACWVTTCRIRAKNAFGAKVLATKLFSKTHLGWSTLGGN